MDEDILTKGFVFKWDEDKYESDLRNNIWNEAIEAAARVVAIELGNTVEDNSYYIEREIRKLKK